MQEFCQLHFKVVFEHRAMFYKSVTGILAGVRQLRSAEAFVYSVYAPEHKVAQVRRLSAPAISLYSITSIECIRLCFMSQQSCTE